MSNPKTTTLMEEPKPCNKYSQNRSRAIQSKESRDNNDDRRRSSSSVSGSNEDNAEAGHSPVVETSLEDQHSKGCSSSSSSSGSTTGSNTVRRRRAHSTVLSSPDEDNQTRTDQSMTSSSPSLKTEGIEGHATSSGSSYTRSVHHQYNGHSTGGHGYQRPYFGNTRPRGHWNPSLRFDSRPPVAYNPRRQFDQTAQPLDLSRQGQSNRYSDQRPHLRQETRRRSSETSMPMSPPRLPFTTPMFVQPPFLTPYMPFPDFAPPVTTNLPPFYGGPTVGNGGHFPGPNCVCDYCKNVKDFHLRNFAALQQPMESSGQMNQQPLTAGQPIISSQALPQQMMQPSFSAVVQQSLISRNYCPPSTFNGPQAAQVYVHTPVSHATVTTDDNRVANSAETTGIIQSLQNMTIAQQPSSYTGRSLHRNVATGVLSFPPTTSAHAVPNALTVNGNLSSQTHFPSVNTQPSVQQQVSNGNGMPVTTYPMTFTFYDPTTGMYFFIPTPPAPSMPLYQQMMVNQEVHQNGSGQVSQQTGQNRLPYILGPNTMNAPQNPLVSQQTQVDNSASGSSPQGSSNNGSTPHSGASGHFFPQNKNARP